MTTQATDTTSTVPLVGNPPPPKKSVDTIQPNLFASTYRSVFTELPEAAGLLPYLKFVNCSYLSTNGEAPTLLELKQHAQALTILIRNLSISTSSAPIDSVSTLYQEAARNGTDVLDEDIEEAGFKANEAFDWLNNLSEVYENGSKSHNLPLTALINNLKPAPEDMAKPICPLEIVNTARAPPTADFTNPLPYAVSHALTNHADSCLELLDHEFSATGGLLSLLPTDGPEKDVADQTILGQLLGFPRILVARVHELEKAYMDCLDVIAGEAIIPREALTQAGATGRVPQELELPERIETAIQDRFVLANAGDEVWALLAQHFDEADLDAATVGDDNRGLVSVDFMTRYYRLRGGKTVFIVPCHSSHPRTAGTIEMQARPTVVQVVKPEWRERASVWETRHRRELEEMRKLEPENRELKRKVEELENDVLVLEHERKMMMTEEEQDRFRQDVAAAKAQSAADATLAGAGPIDVINIDDDDDDDGYDDDDDDGLGGAGGGAGGGGGEGEANMDSMDSGYGSLNGNGNGHSNENGHGEGDEDNYGLTWDPAVFNPLVAPSTVQRGGRGGARGNRGVHRGGHAPLNGGIHVSPLAPVLAAAPGGPVGQGPPKGPPRPLSLKFV